MINIRKSSERGAADHGWLKALHSFSFGHYHDPRHMNFRSLRVINEDRVAGGHGFGTHPHNDMEILTWVLAGKLNHADSMGFEGSLEPGQIQRISAGTGISHSEKNAMPDDELHLLQIWLMPDRAGHVPDYDQKSISPISRQGKLALVAAPVGTVAPDAVLIHQDAFLYVADLDPDAEVSHTLASGRHAWLQVAKGSVILNGTSLKQGDGAMVSDESHLTIQAQDISQVLLFDLA